MKTKFLKRIRQRFTVRYNKDNEVLLFDRTECLIYKFPSIAHVVSFIVPQFYGLSISSEYNQRVLKRERRKRCLEILKEWH